MIVRAPRALLEAAARGDQAHRAIIGLEPRPTRPKSAMVERRVAQRRRADDAVKPAARKPARKRG
jgi:hypothetical protein